MSLNKVTNEMQLVMKFDICGQTVFRQDGKVVKRNFLLLFVVLTNLFTNKLAMQPEQFFVEIASFVSSHCHQKKFFVHRPNILE